MTNARAVLNQATPAGERIVSVEEVGVISVGEAVEERVSGAKVWGVTSVRAKVPVKLMAGRPRLRWWTLALRLHGRQFPGEKNKRKNDRFYILTASRPCEVELLRGGRRGKGREEEGRGGRRGKRREEEFRGEERMFQKPQSIPWPNS